MCKGEWKSSEFYMQIVSKSKERKKGSRRWLTRAQIADKYKSIEIANEICNGKLKDEATRKEQTRPHPDCPDNEDCALVFDKQTCTSGVEQKQ